MNPEDMPIENGEMNIFQLDSEQDRTVLAQWAESIAPGTDLVWLQAQTVPGDLILNRPGSTGFEVFRKTDTVNVDRIMSRIQLLEIAARDVSSNPLVLAQEWDAWVRS